MKKIALMFVCGGFVAVLSSCSIVSEATLFLVSKTTVAGAQAIACNEFIVPVKKNIMGEATVEKAFDALLNVDAKEFGDGLFSSNGLNNFAIEEVAPQDFGTVAGYLVSLKQPVDSKLVDKCEIAQIKAQITETVRAAVKDAPFAIRLNGEPKKWECLGSESPSCK